MAHLTTIAVLLLTLLAGGGALAADDATPDGGQPAQEAQLFAKVGEQTISQTVYEEAYARAVRSRFYHGTPPEGELEQVRRQVAEEIVTRVLLLQEARRLGLTADNAAIQAALDGYDQQYAGTPRWQEQRDELLARVRQKLEEEDLLRQLEARVRDVAPPADEEVAGYYEANLDKFTEPARQQVSVILLQVDPSSSSEVWDAAVAEAEGLVSEIGQGAEFEELARLRSGDRSAENGGNMGYLHAGMLSPAAEEVIAELEIGEVSGPVRLLRGVAIFRVSDRKAARLRDFKDVEVRARELAIREQSDQAWAALQDKLRSGTPISVYTEVGAMPSAIAPRGHVN